jgi:hypothetical protein
MNSSLQFSTTFHVQLGMLTRVVRSILCRRFATPTAAIAAPSAYLALSWVHWPLLRRDEMAFA